MNNWISVDDQLPTVGQVCDVWLIGDGSTPAHRRIDYVFTDKVGVRNYDAFQSQQCYNANLYEEAYFIYENLITHWMPSPENPKTTTND